MNEPESATTDKQPSGTGRPAAKPFHVGDPVPNALGPGELMRVLNLTPAMFYVYQREGKLKRFEFRRPVSHMKRYSGALVKRYLEQEGA